MSDILKHPWPWYVSGPLIGLLVPALLIMGNKYFGISSNFRHLCAALFPARIRFFNYNWKKESWNLFFALGIVAGAFIASQWLANPNAIRVDPGLASELKIYGVSNFSGLLPPEVFSFQALATPRGLILMVVGGFLVGFGTRYAGGCTSGHSITGLSNLQWPSLVATICFMAGGVLMANFVLPLIMQL